MALHVQAAPMAVSPVKVLQVVIFVKLAFGMLKVENVIPKDAVLVSTSMAYAKIVKKTVSLAQMIRAALNVTALELGTVPLVPAVKVIRLWLVNVSLVLKVAVTALQTQTSKLLVAIVSVVTSSILPLAHVPHAQATNTPLQINVISAQKPALLVLIVLPVLVALGVISLRMESVPNLLLEVLVQTPHPLQLPPQLLL